MYGRGGFLDFLTDRVLAHISEDQTREQPLLDHLQNTAHLAAAFSAAFGAEQQGYLAGLLHDIGKYSEEFQQRLHGGDRVDHSTAGAQEACRHQQRPAAFAIAGHHSGLPDMGAKHDSADSVTFFGRMRRSIPNYSRWQQELSFPDTPSVSLPRDSLAVSLYIRMLYSALVDADYIDTETFMKGEQPRGSYPAVPVLLDRLKCYVRERWGVDMEAASPPPAADETVTQQLNRRRSDILCTCLQRGLAGKRGLYTLTVPTGGGKTVSSLAFALAMAAAQNMERVIYVIPYTSIIEQNAGVFAEILGTENVLEHHAGAEYQLSEDADPTAYRKALAAENWDAPLIVTTAVQFFESLYANRSSRCRKLHNIANSVIVFDEAQTIPTVYLDPCVAAIARLVQYYGATAVLCTATQPALESVFQKFAPELSMEEICPEPEQQYQLFRRTTIQDLGQIDEEALAERLNEAEQVLCVVNKRLTAQTLFDALRGEGNYCLTTLLYPAHRKRLLAEIRQRLREGLPCRVVSTSLIEAGVDVDFPVAYREETGLDSILQTAGRCNREGRRRAEESPVFVFRLFDMSQNKKTEQANETIQQENRAIQQKVHMTRMILRDFADPSGPDAIRQYFEGWRAILGDDQLDTQRILKKTQALAFAEIARNFHLIHSPTRTVYIPLGEGATLVEQLRRGERSRSLFRRLGQYGVSVYPEHLEALNCAGKLSYLDEDVVVLVDTSCYSEQTGLLLDVPFGQCWTV